MRIQNDTGKVRREVTNLTKVRDNNVLKKISTPNGMLSSFDLACASNEHFINVGEPLDDPPELDHAFNIATPSSLKSLFFLATSPQKIVTFTNKLKKYASPGHNNIKSIPIRYATLFMFDLLFHLANLMFTTGVFPNDLKIAKVCPI